MAIDQDMEGAATEIALSVVESQERANVDMLVTTAKRYPRHIARSIKQMIAMVTVDQETAISMHYCLKRKSKDGKEKKIEGPSVRLAEIVACCWGNMRSATQALGHDGKVVTSQAFAHDLENNNFVAWQCQRNILNSFGKIFSDDMIVVTSNAAAAIAWRNAILKAIPASTIRQVSEAAKRAALGEVKSNEERWQDAITRFAKYSVSAEQLMNFLQVEHPQEVSTDDLQTLFGVYTAIDQGETTVEQQFGREQQADKPVFKQSSGEPQKDFLSGVGDPAEKKGNGKPK